MSVIVKQTGIQDLREGKRVRLQELIDTRELVTYHELRKVGITPENIRVSSLKYEKFNARAGGRGIDVGMDPKGNDIMSLPSEDFYVIMAHETMHMVDSTKKLRTGKALRGKLLEDNARYWEAFQGAKFQWDERDYAEFVKRLVDGAQRSGDIPYHTASKEIKIRQPVFFAVRRHPHLQAKVIVHRHIRRKVARWP